MPDPSPSTLTVLTPTSYNSKGVVAGHSGQFTPGGYLSTVKHTALAGIEPTTFRLLVRRATIGATETKAIILPAVQVSKQARMFTAGS